MNNLFKNVIPKCVQLKLFTRVLNPSTLNALNSLDEVRQFSTTNNVNFQNHSVLMAKEKKSSSKTPTKTPPLAINGFGRIGKCVLRLAIKNNLNVVAINEPGANTAAIAHSLKYDTVHGIFPGEISVKNDTCIQINDQLVQVYCEKNPEKIKWNELSVQYVIESTGRFTEITTANKHFETGVKKVIISAPSKDAPMFVRGVNFDKYNNSMCIVSNASCTTNCAALLMHIIHNKFCVENCLLTTVHSMTASQHVLDGVKHRSGPGNIIHSSTGAAKAIGLVIPELKGKVTGDSIRVPMLDVSLLKLYINVKNCVSVDDVKCAIWDSVTPNNNDLISVSENKLVSSDFIGNLCSAIVDINQVSVIGDTFITIGAWYDNEMGYSKRLIDLYTHMAKVDMATPDATKKPASK